MLQVENLLVPFVQPRAGRDHDVPLLQQELLVPVDLSLVLVHVRKLALQLLDSHLVLGPDPVVLLLKHLSERVGLLYVGRVATDHDLALHVGDPILQLPLLRLLPEDLSRLRLEGDHGRELVLLRLPPLLLELT